ncbi:MAG: thiamine pyrophosphokinase [Sphingobacteriales bacterium]|nr:MAG: thiamine pyrophosphokinase [Sphingobacteriales bacterium]
MSSHHIVREKQEPALFILEFENFDEEYLGQLLEWNPTVLVAQNVYEKIASMGIKIDAVICNQEKNVGFQEGIKFIETTNEMDLLSEGLKFFINQNYPAVNLICKSFNIKSVYQYVNKIDLVVFANNQKYYPIKSGFNKWSVINLNIEVFGNNFAYQGLKKIGYNRFVTLKNGFFSLNFEDDFLFLAEDL